MSRLELAAAAKDAEELGVLRERVRVIKTHNLNRKCVALFEIKGCACTALSPAQHCADEMQNNAAYLESSIARTRLRRI